jgi:hypothetical protein
LTMARRVFPGDSGGAGTIPICKSLPLQSQTAPLHSHM